MTIINGQCSKAKIIIIYKIVQNQSNAPVSMRLKTRDVATFAFAWSPAKDPAWPAPPAANPRTNSA